MTQQIPCKSPPRYRFRSQARKVGEVGDAFACLFEAACLQRCDARRAVGAMFEMSNAPRVADGRVEYSWVCEGAWRFVGRCLRPIWFKAAVEVKGKKKGKDGKAPLGGTVKVLVSGAVLDRVRAPLHALQNLLRTFFLPAVSTASASMGKSRASGGAGGEGGAESVLTR